MDIDIDLASHKRDIVFEKVHEYIRSIGGDIVRVGTFKTESAKSAIQTSCRGLGIPSDIGVFISSLIPINRGKTRSLHDTYYGNADEGIPPVTEFVNQVNKYDGLLETALGIENLISGRSSHACFKGEELVETSKGLKQIKDVQVGDKVLTHTNTYKQVVKTMTHKTDDTYEVKATGMIKTTTTGNHKFYVRRRLDNRNVKTNSSEPCWVEVRNLVKGDYIGQAINQENIIPQGTLPFNDDDFWWVIGRFLGDGWLESPKRNGEIREYDKRIIICCDKTTDKELHEILEHLSKIVNTYRVEEADTTYKVVMKYRDNEYLYDYLESFGKYAHGKKLNKDIINLPKQLLNSFFEGYMSADGYLHKPTGTYTCKTVSKELAIGLQHVIAKLYNRHSRIIVLPPKQEMFQGSRAVNSREKYEITYTTDERKRDSCFFKDGYIWCPIKEVSKLDELMEVYNITVIDDSSYTVNRAIVHNCGVVFSLDMVGSTAIMRTPNNEVITQYDLGDCEQSGLIKFDLEL